MSSNSCHVDIRKRSFNKTNNMPSDLAFSTYRSFINSILILFLKNKLKVNKCNDNVTDKCIKACKTTLKNQL